MKYFLVFIVSVFMGCESSRFKKPDNLMSEQQMINFLSDLMVLNASRNFRIQRDNSKYFVSDSVLYAFHKVDSVQFADSNRYYASKPKRYERIISRAQARINSLNGEVQQQIDEEKLIKKTKLNRKDSINSDFPVKLSEPIKR